ncbi:MAG: hypothetical protein COV36_07980 [Alphaproteobacteria bacterium CG11_big_fil_rev_8_21_14_0_20_44_7]|nr:MAG: hypothetical protein COV36_07980 [Alphaproteobacteria bacterium CG11_big_fil_rev_8_21_14_0_20_44_7]
MSTKNLSTEDIYERTVAEIIRCDVDESSARNAAMDKSFSFLKRLNAEGDYFQFREKIEETLRMLNDELGCNISYADYVSKAALKQPQLFYQSPERIKNNIKDVVDKLNDELGCDISYADYVSKAELKTPQLFCLSPERIKNNIRDAVDKLNDELGCDIPYADYVKAALKQPQLFYQSPETIKNNIKGIVDKLNGELGCDISYADYVSKAALKQPQLFYRSPETIAQHVKTAFSLHEDYGVIDIPEGYEKKLEHKNAQYPARQFILEKMLAWPVSLNLATDNYKLRAWSEIWLGEQDTKPAFGSLIQKSRKSLTEKMADWLSEPRQDAGREFARSLLLETLVKDKIMPKKYMPEPKDIPQANAQHFQNMVKASISNKSTDYIPK